FRRPIRRVRRVRRASTGDSRPDRDHDDRHERHDDDHRRPLHPTGSPPRVPERTPGAVRFRTHSITLPSPPSPTIRHQQGARFGPQTVRKWPANGPQTDLPTDSKTDPQTPRKQPMTSQDTTADTERPALTRNRESDRKSTRLNSSHVS